jgi:hypothetical protein
MRTSTAALLIGAALGVGAVLITEFFLGPADESTLDETYLSRWDYAVSEGERAAEEYEAELMRQYEGLKIPPSKRPPEGPTALPSLPA